MIRVSVLFATLLVGCHVILPLGPSGTGGLPPDGAAVDRRPADLPVDASLDWPTTASDATVVSPWAVSWGGAANEEGKAVAIDSLGNIYVTGDFGGAVDFGGAIVTSKGQQDAFLLAVAPDGTLRWVQTFGGAATDKGLGVAVDPAGNVTVVGEFGDVVDFGGGPIAAEDFSLSTDLFVASFTRDGKHRWSKGFGWKNRDGAQSVVADDKGNVYVTGYFQDTLDLGGGPLSSTGTQDIFVASLSSTGDHRWSQGFGGPGTYDEGADLTVSPSGEVHVTGEFADTMDIAGTSLTSAGGQDIWVGTFTTGGVHVRSARLGGAGADGGTGISVDGQGHLYLSGYISGTVDFGGGPLTSAGPRDIFVLALDGQLKHRWSVRLGGPKVDAWDEGRDIVVDDLGNVVIGAFFSGTGDFPGGVSYTSNGFSDIYLASFKPDGAVRWSEHVGAGGNDYAYGLATRDGVLAVTGAFEDTVSFAVRTLSSKGAQDSFLFTRVP